MAEPITQKTKGKAKKRPKNTQPITIGTKEGRDLVPLVVGIYLTYRPSNVTCMQISNF
jgi:hypothetical protein